MAGEEGGEPDMRDSDRDVADHHFQNQEENKDSDSDSEEEEVYSEYTDGRHDMTAKELSHYYKQVQATDGFDVDAFPKSFSCGRIEPILDFLNPYCYEDLSRNSAIAINSYNEEHGTSYNFVKVLKANAVVVSGIIYYITFEAKDAAAGLVQTFQARVFDGVPKEDGTPNIIVELCRIKPN